MNTDEKHIARIQLKNRLLSSHGQALEDLFIRIMQASDSDFRPVKSQGKEGDKKNDGFNKKTGQYYQVYSPENPTGKEKDSLEKLSSTITGLIDFWQSISPIKEFYWVFNDHYQGVYPSVEKMLSEIEKQHNISADPFLCRNIEDAFLSLPESEIIDILGGHIPDYTNIENIPINVLDEVIGFLVKFKYDPSKITFPDELNFDKKIRFNKLSRAYGNLLKSAFYQDFIISEYFTYNSKFVKEELKVIFSNFYIEGLATFSDDIPEKSDLVFDFILKKASPRNHKAITDAVLILMSHYFESCDIYEEPKEPKQSELFT